MKKETKAFTLITVLVFFLSFVVILQSGDADKEGLMVSLCNAALISVVPLISTFLVQMVKSQALAVGGFTVVLLVTVVGYFATRVFNFWIFLLILLVEIGLFTAFLLLKRKEQTTNYN